MTMHQGFDAQRWQSERGRRDDSSGARAGMLAALERDHLRNGMTRDAVRRLLGEPDATSPTTDEYDLGPSPVGVTMESYVIGYDTHDSVVSFALRRR